MSGWKSLPSLRSGQGQEKGPPSSGADPDLDKVSQKKSTTPSTAPGDRGRDRVRGQGQVEGQEGTAAGAGDQPPGGVPQGAFKVANPCCCECTLHEGVGWISAVEFVWGLINALVITVFIVSYQNADTRLKKKLSADEEDDMIWQEYGDKHLTMLIACIILHGLETLSSCILLTASGARIRCLCYLWIFITVVIIGAEIGVTILDPFVMTYVLHPINLFRLYFFYIVYCFSEEIRVWPKGPPMIMEYIQDEADRMLVDANPVKKLGYNPHVYKDPSVRYYLSATDSLRRGKN